MQTDRLEEGAAWAAQLHNGHLRKGTTIPYVSHLFAVASLVLEDGGTEDEAIAALLHDAVEDGKTTLDAIGERFGAEVAAIVEACSDTVVNPKPPWRERKERYVAHLYDEATPAGALRVSAADKVHNARCILADFKAIGDELWSRFNVDAQSADAQLWYYENLVDAFTARRPDSALTASWHVWYPSCGPRRVHARNRDGTRRRRRPRAASQAREGARLSGATRGPPAPGLDPQTRTPRRAQAVLRVAPSMGAGVHAQAPDVPAAGPPAPRPRLPRGAPSPAVGTETARPEVHGHLDVAPAHDTLEFVVPAPSRVTSAIPLGLGYFWMPWDPERQCWHDKMATDIVVTTPRHPVDAWPG